MNNIKPEKAVENKKAERSKNEKALEIIVSDIQEDPDSTKRKNKLASAIIALKEA